MTRLARFLARHLIDFDVHGIENIPRRGRLIVYFNHINFLDAVLAVVLVPREVVVLSKAENFRHLIFGPLARGFGAIPVRRGEADTRAFKRALAVLNAGKALLIAPEGTRSGHGRLQQAKDGLTLLALRTNATLVPIGLVGQKAFFSSISGLRRTRVCAWVGQPFHMRVPEGTRLTRQEIRTITGELMREMAVLLPAPNRGVYSEGIELPRRWIVHENGHGDHE